MCEVIIPRPGNYNGICTNTTNNNQTPHVLLAWCTPRRAFDIVYGRIKKLLSHSVVACIYYFWRISSALKQTRAEIMCFIDTNDIYRGTIFFVISKTIELEEAIITDDVFIHVTGSFHRGACRCTLTRWYPGPRLNIKTVLSTYGDSHVKDKTAVRTSYL